MQSLSTRIHSKLGRRELPSLLATLICFRHIAQKDPLSTTFLLRHPSNRAFLPFDLFPLTLFCVTPFFSTLGQKETFYPEMIKNFMFEKCEFCDKWDFGNVNFATNEILKLWISWKVKFWKLEFCEKCDFENMNIIDKYGFLPDYIK